jgi:hypothetical protein
MLIQQCSEKPAQIKDFNFPSRLINQANANVNPLVSFYFPPDDDVGQTFRSASRMQAPMQLASGQG